MRQCERDHERDVSAGLCSHVDSLSLNAETRQRNTRQIRKRIDENRLTSAHLDLKLRFIAHEIKTRFNASCPERRAR